MEKAWRGVNFTSDKNRPVPSKDIDKIEAIAQNHKLHFVHNPVFGYFYSTDYGDLPTFYYEKEQKRVNYRQNKKDWVFRLDLRKGIIRTNRGLVSFWYPQDTAKHFLKEIFRLIEAPIQYFQSLNHGRLLILPDCLDNPYTNKSPEVNKSKAFDIIISKRIDINVIIEVETYEEYLTHPADYPIIDEEGNYHPEFVLTREEFDLIRESIAHGKN